MQRALVLACLLAAPITASSAIPSGKALPGAGMPGSGPSGWDPFRQKGEEAEFESEDGVKLVGTFWQPRKDRSPAVVLVHDAGGDRSQLTSVAERLHKEGFGVLTFDLRGHGQSKTARTDWSKLSEKDQTGLWVLGMRDIEAAAHWILEQPSIHSTNLSLVGYGAGCALVARHARDDENVACMALLSPRAEDYGFDVKADIQFLEGLPTYVVARREDETEGMIQEANAQTSGNPYIELVFATSKVKTVLEDRKMPGKVASWIGSNVELKKGRG